MSAKRVHYKDTSHGALERMWERQWKTLAWSYHEQNQSKPDEEHPSNSEIHLLDHSTTNKDMRLS
jgi:hypothetical protein